MCGNLEESSVCHTPYVGLPHGGQVSQRPLGTLELPAQESRSNYQISNHWTGSMIFLVGGAAPWELRRPVSALRGGFASLNARPASALLPFDPQNSRSVLVKASPHFLL